MLLSLHWAKGLAVGRWGLCFSWADEQSRGFRFGVRGQGDASSASLLLNPLGRRWEVEGKHGCRRQGSG